MARFFLVRHGETDWNRKGRYQGRTDVELNAKGVWQAERLRERLSGQDIGACYSSDLVRALGTTRIVTSKHKLEVVPCPELREVDFGDLEGMTFDEIRQRYPGWGRVGEGFSIPGGESLEQLEARIEPFLSRLLQRYTGDETVLVVSHGALLRVLLCALLGFDLGHWWQMRLDSASLTIVDSYPERIMLSLLNDTCHLEVRR